MIKCILFDLDGTLVAAKEWHYEALNLALVDHGYQKIPHDIHLAHFDGLPTRVKLEKLGIVGTKATEVNASKQIFTQQVIKKNCKPDLELRREIAKLWHLGYRMAIYSNAVRASCDAMIWGLGIADYFWFWISNEEVDKPKPDPEGWLRAMQTFGVAPCETIIVEDSEVGVTSAKASGAHVVIVKSPQDVTCHDIFQVAKEISNAAEHSDADRRSRATV